MTKILHILRSEPDEMVESLVHALGEDDGTTVVCLYLDSVSGVQVNWHRLIDDIFNHERVICWW